MINHPPLTAINWYCVKLLAFISMGIRSNPTNLRENTLTAESPGLSVARVRIWPSLGKDAYERAVNRGRTIHCGEFGKFS